MHGVRWWAGLVCQESGVHVEEFLLPGIVVAMELLSE